VGWLGPECSVSVLQFYSQDDFPAFFGQLLGQRWAGLSPAEAIASNFSIVSSILRIGWRRVMFIRLSLWKIIREDCAT
jgi:hypothetical protein